MDFVYSDGGRSKYFKAKNVRDCVVRAICNASGKDYKEVYKRINQLSVGDKHNSSSRNGVNKKIYKKYIEKELGWVWVSTANIGQVDKTHLCEDELPMGNLIVRCSHHLTCVKDGVLYDTYDCTRDDNRLVYGYWVDKNDREYVEYLERQQ